MILWTFIPPDSSYDGYGVRGADAAFLTGRGGLFLNASDGVLGAVIATPVKKSSYVMGVGRAGLGVPPRVYPKPTRELVDQRGRRLCRKVDPPRTRNKVVGALAHDADGAAIGQVRQDEELDLGERPRNQARRTSGHERGSVGGVGWRSRPGTTAR